MKQLILLIAILYMSGNVMSQKKLASLANINIGYGTENDYGNTGFVFGIGYQNPVSRKVDFQADLNYFTTGIYNAYLKNDRSFPGEVRLYHNTILSAKLGYAAIGDIEKFNIRIKAGASAFLYKYKILSEVTFIVLPDGSKQVIPGSISYYDKKGARIAYNFGLDINMPISKSYQIAFAIDTYSSSIPIEFFIPSLSLKAKL